jgi:hypothetical protein
LFEDFFNIIAKSSNPIATTLRVLGRLLRNVLKIAAVIGLFFVGNQIYDLAVDYFGSMQELCKQHNSDQMDIIAQKYLAADKYFNDMGKCYQAGCCDDEIDCKGLGGWCTRIRNGPDFTYYTHCCDTCDCGGDDACIKAFCSSCDPSSPCSNTGTDNTDDTQTGSGTESLPTYLFQSSLTAKQGCPPLPPGWQRHQNGTDPDPRSSPEWDVEIFWPTCDTFGEFGSWVGDIMKYWQEIFGGTNPGNGTSTTAD